MVRHLNDTLTIRYDHFHEDIQQLSKYMNMSEIDVSHIQTHAHRIYVPLNKNTSFRFPLRHKNQ
jgi:hypothetical protein